MRPIQAIPIQTFSPQDLPSNQTCSTYEAEHVTLIQQEPTSPPETQPPQPSPKSTPHKEPRPIKTQL